MNILGLISQLIGIKTLRLTASIYNSIDLALDLLRRYPALALALDANKQASLLALASISFAYPSVNQLIFWKQ